MRTAKTLSDWADAQADLSLRWAHTHFVGFVMSQLIYVFKENCRKFSVIIIKYPPFLFHW